MQLLIIEKDAKSSHATANAKSDYKACHKIDKNIGLIGFARLAVVLRVATLAFDMAHHFRSDRAAPPSVVDWFGV